MYKKKKLIEILTLSPHSIRSMPDGYDRRRRAHARVSLTLCATKVISSFNMKKKKIWCFIRNGILICRRPVVAAHTQTVHASNRRKPVPVHTCWEFYLSHFLTFYFNNVTNFLSCIRTSIRRFTFLNTFVGVFFWCRLTRTRGTLPTEMNLIEEEKKRRFKSAARLWQFFTVIVVTVERTLM